MTALDVISLQSAKDYLRVDYSEDDAIITRLIKASVSRIEQYTNYKLYQRDVVYNMYGCELEIYDFPITLDTTLKTRQNVLSVTVFGRGGDVINASVGYSLVAGVPEDLLTACYMLITAMYENRDVYSLDLPLTIQGLINQYRRSPSI